MTYSLSKISSILQFCPFCSFHFPYHPRGLQFGGNPSFRSLWRGEELATCSWKIVKFSRAPGGAKVQGEGHARGGGANSTLLQKDAGWKAYEETRVVARDVEIVATKAAMERAEDPSPSFKIDSDESRRRIVSDLSFPLYFLLDSRLSSVNMRFCFLHLLHEALRTEQNRLFCGLPFHRVLHDR
ncbi:hypothetical protein EUGRSUZ_E00892 [Eucalyptus grandis]|uniref:Uncharacterized protein n=2 Tax=Eucalyptus grandis TaxID=71139 RepID=A0ACC3KT33_EUCGR|nr:hypothetical protein EUGRSUZ_E00892 [Eucalyptus grandis]